MLKTELVPGSLPVILSFILLVGGTARSQSQTLSPEASAANRIISRSDYHDALYGFWLGQCIANWTGLVTEMDKIGNIGDIQTGPFYTRDDWGAPDQPNIWNPEHPSDISDTIGFVFEDPGAVWGADDDTDIEYLYQHLLDTFQTAILKPEQIRQGWLRHIRPEEENYLWVSNQTAYDLMRKGLLPPATSDPDRNPHYEMIDAQLTTEIFGLFAPGRPDLALEMAYLPIRTTARGNAAWIAEFYIIMHSLAAVVDTNQSRIQQIRWMADSARTHLPDTSYAAKMYDFVLDQHQSGASWEMARDAIYQRYQVAQDDGYDFTSRELYCNACYAAGINFAASLISLFYGEGNLKATIKIGALAGWDSDNPTATWAGLLGFMYGKKGIEAAFGRKFAERFHIHRTRRNFTHGVDHFDRMAEQGCSIVDRVVQELMGGKLNSQQQEWVLPTGSSSLPAAE